MIGRLRWMRYVDWRERLMIRLAWMLPRGLALWAFVRVATTGRADFPGDQTVSEAMERWDREARRG